MTHTYFYSNCGKLAVIIEKLGRDEWKMSRWNKELNTFEEGQTIRHKQVDVKRCVISDDGQQFLWFYTQYSIDRNGHFGICTPPRFTSSIYGTTMGRYFRSKFVGGKFVISGADINIAKGKEIAENILSVQY